jgi:hypothetical protein
MAIENDFVAHFEEHFVSKRIMNSSNTFDKWNDFSFEKF